MRIIKTKQKEKYYDGSDIAKTGATYRLVVGMRSNGKTYYTISRAIIKFFKEGKPSAYLRRYAEDINAANITNLIEPHLDLIKRLSKNKYNCYEYRNNTFKFTYTDSKGSIKARSEDFLYTVSLATWEHQKGSDKAPEGLALLIFDEFLTRGKYLTNEFPTFTNVISSFIRNRPGTEIWMLANTVSRYGNPYFLEMGLNDTDSMKQGEIRLYTYNNELLTVALEYCAESTAIKNVEHYYAFDNPQLSILTTGNWEEESYRHWTPDLFKMNDETFRYKVLLQFQGHEAIGEVHKTDTDLIVFWHPKGSSNYKFTDKDTVYTDEPTPNRRWSNYLNSTATKKLARITYLMANNKDFYSDNTIGELIRSFRLWNGGK